jgi:prepilin-type N-terminal cleavage/methylation domain-containing protein
MKLMRHGFSLIEVLISLVMVSITITSLLTLLGSLQKILFKDNSQWHAEQLAMQAFVDAEKLQPAESGKTIEREQDDFKIVYSVSKPQDGTPLAEIENLVIEKVVVSWTKVMATQTFTFVKYSYRPKPSEKNKEPQTAASLDTDSSRNPLGMSGGEKAENTSAQKAATSGVKP